MIQKNPRLDLKSAVCDFVNADVENAMHEYGLQLTAWKNLPTADAVVIAVAHETCQRGAAGISECLTAEDCIVDVKSLFGRGWFEMRRVWTL